MKQNLGWLDRIFRFALGVWLISWVLPVLKGDLLWWLVVVVAAWSLLESFTAYCCLHKWCKINNKNQ